ncbi:MAG: N-acetylmuramoyl-L-alanine amidase [Clostridia bacterium]|nr:N-acetylmuramoyl-L-alanine amidase [Clostridia bacterium]
MKNFSEKIFRKIALGIEILLMIAMVLTASACESAEEEETVKDRLGQATGIPSIGVGRQRRETADQTGKGFTICIDPGHGFDDAGASSSYVADCDEKDLTLRYATDLKSELEKMGYTIILTHDGSVFPRTSADDGNNKFNPNERSAYANTLDIDYYVSLHCDSFEDESIGGTRIYYCEAAKKVDDYSADVANAIKMQLSKAFPEDGEIKIHNMDPAEAYAVIRETYAAASLIEIGFITNANDAARIQDAEWQEDFVEAVAAGINDYFATLG